MYRGVRHWPSTEPSIKRCTCVSKRTNSETDASGRRYRNITLIRGRGWIRWWWQMHTATGSKWMSNKNITRCHRRLESVRIAFGDRVPAEWEPAPDKGLGPSVTHGLAAQPGFERSAAIVRRTLGQYVAVCPRLQLTSHTQPTSTLSNKVWEVYFYKEVCSFVHRSSYIMFEYVSAYICIGIMCMYTYSYSC